MLALASAYSANVNSIRIQFNGFAYVSVCVCMCVCIVALLSFSRCPALSFWFIHSFIFRSHSFTVLCWSVPVCVRLFSTDTLKCACSHHICTTYGETERYYIASIYSIYVYLSIYRFITHTPTHTYMHTLIRSQTKFVLQTD